MAAPWGFKPGENLSGDSPGGSSAISMGSTQTSGISRSFTGGKGLQGVDTVFWYQNATDE
ncbi:MAG TPA: hypothetical protein DIW61_14080 [Candidatus Aminicenantes bacterium]|nr:hypothetical protein [Candidatus Aminicenantes bacterium]